MPDQESSENTEIDAKKSSACGICRAMGVGLCKGHGGGASGGGNSAEDEGLQSSGTTPENQPSHLKSVVLSSFLESSELWKESSEDQLFELDNEALSIKLSLDLGKNKLVIEPTPSLRDEDKKALYDGVIKELANFANEQGREDLTNAFNIVGGKLTIQFPADQKLFDSFVEKLMEKNLIPGPTIEKALQESPLVSEQVASVREPESERSNLPRAFDIPSVDTGPLPPGGGEDS